VTDLDLADAAELDRLLHQASEANTTHVLRSMVDGTDVDQTAIDTIAAHCSVDHVATLTFPAIVDDVSSYLLKHRWRCLRVVPSGIVRERLAHRYDLEHQLLEVSIIRASTHNAAGVEIFCLPLTAATKHVADRERQDYHERHTALMVNTPDNDLLDELRFLVTDKLAMSPDGGGHNPHEDQKSNGRSVLYFRHPAGSRLELTCIGNFTPVVARHLDSAL
jgi:hypothetical protein